MLKIPTLAEYVQEYLYSGLSVCVFVNYRETLAALAKLLDTRSLIFGDQEKFKISRDQTKLQDFLNYKP
jgi:hypothetical protein